MVGEFRQTDFTSAPDTDASEYKSQIDENFGVHNEIAGQFAPHEESVPNMTVKVDAGRLLYNSLLKVWSLQTTGTIVAPVTDPRIDRIVIDESTGGITVVTGAEDPNPVAPDIPVGFLPCCQVSLETTTTAITNSMITDERASIEKTPPPTSWRYVELSTPDIISGVPNDDGAWHTISSAGSGNVPANAVAIDLSYTGLTTTTTTLSKYLRLSLASGNSAPGGTGVQAHPWTVAFNNSTGSSQDRYTGISWRGMIKLNGNGDFHYCLSTNGVIAATLYTNDFYVHGYWVDV